MLGDRRPTTEDIQALRFTTRVLNESMRLYPQPPVLIRRALADDVLYGYKVLLLRCPCQLLPPCASERRSLATGDPDCACSAQVLLLLVPIRCLLVDRPAQRSKNMASLSMGLPLASGAVKCQSHRRLQVWRLRQHAPVAQARRACQTRAVLSLSPRMCRSNPCVNVSPAP